MVEADSGAAYPKVEAQTVQTKVRVLSVHVVKGEDSMGSVKRAGPAENEVGKRAWERPMLTYVGNVGAVLQGGGGKLTPSPNDPGEVRKPKGNGA